MPRQNRVTPAGDIIAAPARGLLMGNRGCLHNEQGQIVRPYRGQRWIFCRLEFKGRRRTLMAPGHYTELFFLDEATALAAGHRPCKECSLSRYQAFVAAWVRANPEPSGRPGITAASLDEVLHQERLNGRQKATYPEKLSHLPRGCLVELEERGQPYLVLEDRLLPWQPEGYGQALPRLDHQIARVLTPPSVVRLLARGGYRVGIHPSAF